MSLNDPIDVHLELAKKRIWTSASQTIYRQ